MDAIPERSQTDTRKLKGLPVPVQTAQKALATRTLHDGKGMAAHADRAVEIAPARFWGQRVHRFVQQYGNVYGFRRRHGSIGIHWFVSSCCKSIAVPAAGVFRLHVAKQRVRGFLKRKVDAAFSQFIGHIVKIL